MFECLPKDIKLIVYRLIFDDKYSRLKEQYEKFWIKFRYGIGWRNLTKESIYDGYTFIYKFTNSGKIRFEDEVYNKLPPNYI